MNVEETAVTAMQFLLAAVWTFVFIFIAITYMQYRLKGGPERVAGGISENSRIKRSFYLFMFVFMPMLFLWLPMISRLQLADQYYAPAVLAWLTLLLMGSIVFYLGLDAHGTAWKPGIDGTVANPIGDAASTDGVGGREH